MNRLTLAGITALAATFSAFTPGMGLPQAPGVPRSPVAAVQRTVYPNGLVLLCKEVHAAPVVSVWMYYRVGSRNEVQGQLGISHQVEHMMFKGTEKLGPGDIDRLFSERGGVNNAMTTQDFTAYNETLPSSALPVALRVEADRMRHSAMDPDQLTHERTVVLSELEGDENSPAFKLDAAVTEAAFEANPYRNPVGGYLYDVHRFTDKQVRDYYLSHYAPNNCTIVVVGDFVTSVLKKVVGGYFATDHPIQVETHLITQERPQNGERRVNVEGVGDTGYVEIAYHVPETGARDHYVMDVISTVLGSGRSSRLYRALVEKGLATEVSAGDPDMKDPFLMEITATVAAGHTQVQVEQAIESELDALTTNPVSADELKKTINQVKASFVYRDDSVTSQASDLGFYASILDYRYLDTYLDRISALTTEDVQRVAAQYFTRENRTVGWFIPRPPRPGEAPPTTGHSGPLHYRPTHKALLAAGASPAAPGVGPLTAGLESLIGRKHRRHVGSTGTGLSAGTVSSALLARLTPTGSATRPVVLRRTLPNGMVVVVYPNHSNPDVSISGSLKAGAFLDPPGKAGLANFTATMLDRGTTTRTEEQFASALDFVGANIDVSAGGSGTFFTAHCLDENLPLVLEMLSDGLQNPAFATPVFDRVKNELLTAIKEADDDPASVSNENLFANLYPADHPLHWQTMGDSETVRAITREDLREFHSRYYRPDLVGLVVVGDVDPDQVFGEISRAFGEWTAVGPIPTTEPPAPEGQASPTRVVKTMPEKSEALVSIGFRGISRSDPRYYPAYLMNLIMGNDDFNSRLMKDVRDRQGLVYYVASHWTAGILPGPWVLEMETNPANVDAAVAAALTDVRAMQKDGATPAEMRLFKGWVTGNQALQLETDAGVADMLMQANYFDLGANYLWNYPRLIDAVTLKQVKAAAADLLHPESAVISIAGPYPQPAAPPTASP